MDTSVFKQAIQRGWRPIMEDGKTEFTIKKNKVTWIPHIDRCIVQTDRGKLLLDDECLEWARVYNLEYDIDINIVISITINSISPEALKYMGEGHTRGKIVVHV